MKRRGRTIATIAGLGFLGIAPTLVLRWHDVVTHVHLSRLHADPNYVMEIIEQPEGTPARKAVLQFVQTDEGRQFLVDFCFRALESWMADQRKRALQDAGVTSALQYSRTAAVVLVDGSFQWEISSRRLSIGGNADIFEQIGAQRHQALFSVLRSLIGQSFALDGYPQQNCSIVSVRELPKRFDFQGEEGLGLIMEHDLVRLEPARRLVGSWESWAQRNVSSGADEHTPRISALRFLESGRFFVSMVSDDQSEVLKKGTYEVDDDELRLIYDGSGWPERYTFQLDHSDTLMLQSPDGYNAFRRPTDVPESWRNKIGISALTMSE